jgi:hypothetical protein
VATDPEARKDAAEARLPEVWEPEFLRTFAREAARRGVEIKLPSATLDKLADGIDVLVSELEAAQKERDELIAATPSADRLEEIAKMLDLYDRVVELADRILPAKERENYLAADHTQMQDDLRRLAAAVSATPTPTKENA